MDKPAPGRTLVTGWLLHNTHADQGRIKTGWDQGPEHEEWGCKEVG